jgi:hypothetical protein
LAYARHPRIFGRTAPTPTARCEPADQVGKGGKRVVKEHDAEARDQSVIGLFRRSRRRHVRNFKGDGAFIGSFAAASQFEQGQRERSRERHSPLAPGAGSPASSRRHRTRCWRSYMARRDSAHGPAVHRQGVSIASMPASWARHFSPRAVAQSVAAGFSFMIPILPIECWWRGE